jgi:RNA polymerase-binding transcription factor DksA
MPLSKKQIEELGRRIEARRDALLAEIRADVARARDEPFGELAGPAHDTGDEAVADLLSDLANAETTRDLTELREIEAARARFRDGGYGLCTDCGGEIPLGRLRIKPEAVRCTDCQTVHEKTFAHPSVPKL